MGVESTEPTEAAEITAQASNGSERAGDGVSVAAAADPQTTCLRHRRKPDDLEKYIGLMAQRDDGQPPGLVAAEDLDPFDVLLGAEHCTGHADGRPRSGNAKVRQRATRAAER